MTFRTLSECCLAWQRRHLTQETGVTGNLYIADPSQKRPDANDNVQNNT
jgi:hypothetical protein